MNISKNILIQQLKQQQRLGAKKNIYGNNKKLADDAAKAGRVIKGVTDVFQAYSDQVFAAADEQARLGAGLSKTRGIFDQFSKAAKDAAKNIGSIFEASKDLNTSFLVMLHIVIVFYFLYLILNLLILLKNQMLLQHSFRKMYLDLY